MNRSFYPKLAASNMKKNGKIYLPFLITCIITIAVFYIFNSLTHNEGLKNMFGGNSLIAMLGLGSWIIAIFACIFLFYTNSFIIKRRKKEFGLFNILGMEKRHIARLIALETIYVAVISLIVGLGIGIVLDKLMFLILTHLLKAEITLGFYISISSIVSTLELFGVIYLAIFLNSLRQLHLAQPIALLKGGSTGEKEPKAKWLMAIVGVLCLIGGYYISIVTTSPLAAMLLFFVAVLLVILGTYLLFTTGSIVWLKMLKKNKKYYYQTKHFTSVSGMIYRMKQNAVGLGNICILSTMVLVMVSTTTSTMIGLEDMINTNYPYDINIRGNIDDKENKSWIMDLVHNTLENESATIVKDVNYQSLMFSLQRDKKTSDIYTISESYNEGSENLFFITLDDYNQLTGLNRTLGAGEVLIHTYRGSYHFDSIKILDREYQIVDRVDKFLDNYTIANGIIDTQMIVLPSLKEMSNLNKIYYKAVKGEVLEENWSLVSQYNYSFDLDIKGEEQDIIYEHITEQLSKAGKSYSVSSRAREEADMIGLFGGLFFIGIFLGTLFLMATILIIYYKQISEGYEDKARFEIMSNIGMSMEEIQESIKSQVLTVFYLPLITAGIHVAFAFPIISRLLALMNLSNTKLYVLCTVVTFIVFSLVYGLIYRITAKTYYKIVSSK